MHVDRFSYTSVEIFIAAQAFDINYVTSFHPLTCFSRNGNQR